MNHNKKVCRLTVDGQSCCCVSGRGGHHFSSSTGSGSSQLSMRWTHAAGNEETGTGFSGANSACRRKFILKLSSICEKLFSYKKKKFLAEKWVPGNKINLHKKFACTRYFLLTKIEFRLLVIFRSIHRSFSIDFCQF